MATVAQLVDAISVVTMVNRKTVNVYARALIDDGVLPKAKGKAIPQVNGEETAKLLLAIALQPTVKTAADTIEEYCKLEAETNLGTVTAIDILSDLFGAASAGGLSGQDWQEVSFKVYENRLGIDVHLPGGGSLIFRSSVSGTFGELAGFFLSPNSFFSRSANVSFAGLLFLCQVMKARRPTISPNGREVMDRLLSITQKNAPADGHRLMSIFEDEPGEDEASSG